MKAEFEVIYEGGTPKMVVPSLALMDQCLAWEGKKGKLTLEVYGKKKTNPMNRYFYGVFVEHVKKCMYEQGDARTTEEVIWDLKNRFFHYYKEVNGKRRKYPRSFKNSEWGTVEFQDELNKCRNWFISFYGYTIPLPNEADYNV